MKALEILPQVRLQARGSEHRAKVSFVFFWCLEERPKTEEF